MIFFVALTHQTNPMKKTLLILALTVFTATLSFGVYPNVQFRNTTTSPVSVVVNYSGCRNDVFTVPAGGMAGPSVSRGACLITWISATGARNYTSSGTAYSMFTLIKHPNGATHVHRTDAAFAPQDLDLSCGVASSAATATPPVTKITIGPNPALGGYVIQVSADGLSGLVAETQDQANLHWLDATTAVLNNPVNHSVDGKKFSDWRLPTTSELAGPMNTYKVQLKFSGGQYWSSMHCGQNAAMCFDFQTGKLDHYREFWDLHVRAVRGFGGYTPFPLAKKHQCDGFPDIIMEVTY